MENTASLKSINGDILKFIAAAAMLIDHIGAILYPYILPLRIVGRIAFPIFAFFIAEGCYYTQNKGRYLSNLAVFAVVTQLVKIVFGDNDDLNIMFTFAAGVVVVFALQGMMAALNKKDKKAACLELLLFASAVFAVWVLNRLFVIQYAFWGCMAPCIVYSANYIKNSIYTKQQLKLLMLSVALAAVYMVYGGVQIWAYASVVLLVFYSGKKGDRVPKYFFYIFYPSHLAILYMIKIFI